MCLPFDLLQFLHSFHLHHNPSSLPFPHFLIFSVFFFASLFIFVHFLNVSHYLPWGLSQHPLRLIIRVCTCWGHAHSPCRGQRTAPGIQSSSSSLLSPGPPGCLCHTALSRIAPRGPQGLAPAKSSHEQQLSLSGSQRERFLSVPSPPDCSCHRWHITHLLLVNTAL